MVRVRFRVTNVWDVTFNMSAAAGIKTSNCMVTIFTHPILGDDLTPIGKWCILVPKGLLHDIRACAE